jgi:hypothetical protein
LVVLLAELALRQFGDPRPRPQVGLPTTLALPEFEKFPQPLTLFGAQLRRMTGMLAGQSIGTSTSATSGAATQSRKLRGDS